MAAIQLPRNLRSLVMLGVLAYLFFALLTFPATTAIRWLAPDPVLASDISGSVWSGRAGSMQVDALQFRDVQWNFRPLALITARASFELDAQIGSGAVQTTASFSPGGKITLRDLAGVIPVSALSGFVPVDSVEGRIGLDLASLQIESNWVSDARGSVDLVNLELLAPVRELLGSYAVIFDGAGEDGLTGQFREVDAPLEARGALVLRPDQSWRLEGTVKAQRGASAQLSRGLTMLGPRNPDGSYQLLFESD